MRSARSRAGGRLPRDRGCDDAGASGVGIAAAATMVARPRAVAAPPGAAYRSPSVLRLRPASAPPLDLAVLLALGLIIVGGIGGSFLYTKIQDQLNTNRRLAVPT